MKKYILGTLIVGLSFNACNNPNEKEIGEVEALITKVNVVEKELLSLDTAKIFSTKRQLEKDLAIFHAVTDTLNKADAFKAADIFGSKKKFYRLTARYPKFIAQIETSKKQLDNLKQDLENGLIKKENYVAYYTEEQVALKELDFQINKLITGIDVVVDKYETDRSELLSLIEEIKQKAASHD